MKPHDCLPTYLQQVFSESKQTVIDQTLTASVSASYKILPNHINHNHDSACLNAAIPNV